LHALAAQAVEHAAARAWHRPYRQLLLLHGVLQLLAAACWLPAGAASPAASNSREVAQQTEDMQCPSLILSMLAAVATRSALANLQHPPCTAARALLALHKSKGTFTVLHANAPTGSSRLHTTGTLQQRCTCCITAVRTCSCACRRAVRSLSCCSCASSSAAAGPAATPVGRLYSSVMSRALALQ
jgi:hypothetical protein